VLFETVNAQCSKQYPTFRSLGTHPQAKWYTATDAALNGQHSISPPLMVAANLTATTGGTVSASASSSAGQPQRKRPRGREAFLENLQEQAERDEERAREADRRDVDRKRAHTERAERYLSLFEQLVNKLLKKL